ncbi:protein kinase family protein [Parafrankia sp. FMc2]|uniref:protein kinase family protein n=1 Tax=Parafrankia sp. FMc2 TaxID=3233196 RepID=UPI0034D52E24
MVDGSNRPQGADVDNDVTNEASVQGPASTAVLAESVLDRRYRLLAPLNTRGPVTLWRGDDNVLARPVAVRIVEHLDSDEPDAEGEIDQAALEEIAQALLRAAISSGRFVHPGAASTYDATTTTTGSARVSYVVSEWVEGRTLRQLATETPLRPEQAGAIVLAAARVLAAAHERGIHHGGLNPGDVIVSGHGTVKVVDLEIGGILAGLDGAVTGAEPTIGSTEAEGGDDAGTGTAGDLADVRALGALLYAGLTGTWPLVGEHALPAAPTSDGRLRTPRQINSAVPRDLDAITLATLGDERAGAPITTAADLVAELEAVSPVDQVLDTGLMSLGDDGPVSTEAMSMDPYGPGTADYPSNGSYQGTGGYQDSSGYNGHGGYGSNPTNGYGGRERQGYDQTSYLGRGGYDQTSYDERGYGARGGYDERDNRGYDDRDRGYDGYPAQRGPSEPRRYDGGGPVPPSDGRRGGGADGPGGTARRLLPWLALLVVIALVAVVAVIALNPKDGDGEPGAETGESGPAVVQAGQKIQPEAVVAFDPPPSGDGQENPDSLPQAWDGRLDTQWTTSGYNLPRPFGGLKTGVGLQFTFNEPISPSQVEVTVGDLGPVSFELRASDTPAAVIDGYQVVDVPQQDKSGPVTIGMPSEQTAYKYWVVWLTKLPTVEGKFKGSLAEVEFRN